MKPRKKISSIININSETANLKFGTIDRKKPSVIFIDGGFYIMPSANKNDCKSEINSIRKQLQTIIKSNIETDLYFKPDFMFFTDIADDRIFLNKKTYFSFQLFLKPKDNVLKTDDFKTFMNKMSDKEKYLKIIENEMIKNNYSISKTKK